MIIRVILTLFIERVVAEEVVVLTSKARGPGFESWFRKDSGQNLALSTSTEYRVELSYAAFQKKVDVKSLTIIQGELVNHLLDK